MSELQPGETRRFVDLVPSWWFKALQGSSVWITGYRVLRTPKECFSSGPKMIDLALAQVRAIVLHGTVTYMDASEARIEIIEDDRWRLDPSKTRERVAPEGVYLLLLAPHQINGSAANEAVTREHLGVAAGLLAAFNGRNMVYEHLFDNIIEMADERTSAFTPVVDNPFWFAPPDVSDSRLDTISKADRAIAALPQSDRNRLCLSLRWFGSAIHDDGVDAYLKYWIALETLGMRNTTDIRPLEENLSRAYNLSLEEVHKRFWVGRLFGLRCRIVHDGQIVPIHGRLSRYMEALYADILHVSLGLPCEQRAGKMMADPEFALDRYLHER